MQKNNDKSKIPDSLVHVVAYAMFYYMLESINSLLLSYNYSISMLQEFSSDMRKQMSEAFSACEISSN